MRKWLAAALLLTWSLLVPGAALAEGQAVTMTATAGYDGLGKSGRWVPVQAIITNKGAELEGTLRFEVTEDMGAGKSTGVYEHAVVVPAGATKRISLLMPADMRGLATLKLIVGPETAAEAVPVAELTGDLLLGVLGVEPADLKGLGSMQIGVRTMRMAVLDAAILPADPLGLESLDAILLDQFTWTELPEVQRQAIQGWVEHGGALVLAGGPEARRLEGMAPWIPFHLKGVETVNLEGVGQAPVASLDLQAWEVTRRLGDRPIAARYRKGAGTVHLLTFDPSLEPFASWTGLRPLMAELFATSGQVTPANMMGKGGPMGPKAAMIMTDGLTQFPVRAMPSLKGLLYLLAGYALIAGPVHLLLLRRFRRAGWALLTIPFIAAAGAGTAWSFTKLNGLSDVTANTLTVIEGQPGATSYRVQSLAGFFLPPGASHSVALGDALLQPGFSPHMYMPGMQGPPPDTKLTVELGRTAALKPQERWGMRTVVASAIVPGSGTVEGAVVLNGQRAEGRLTSRLPFGLKDAVIISGGSFQQLGNIDRDAAVDVSLNLFTNAQELGNPHLLAEMVNRTLQINNMGPSGPTPEQYEMMRRQRMAWGAVNTVSWLQAAQQPPVVLVGWTDHEVLPLTVDGRKASSGTMGLYVQPIPHAYPSADFAVQHGFIRPSLVQMEGGTPMLMPGWNMAQHSNAVVQFEIPPQLVARVTDMEVKAPVLHRGPSGKFPLQLSLYRWTDGTWQRLDAPDGTASLAAPGFVGPDGQVRLQLTKTTEEAMPLAVPSLSVRGKAVQP